MQSLQRFLDILETVARSERGVGAADVAKAVDLPIATVSRLMHVLTDYGLLHRPPGGREYLLGPRLFALVSTAMAQPDLISLARPYLELLRDTTQETASLHIRRGTHRVCILEVPSHHKVRRVVPIGMAEQLGASATGAVLLSGMPEEERGQLLADLDLDRERRELVDEEIGRVAANGWVLSADRWVAGLCSISAAIDRGGERVAALSVSGPLDRFTREKAGEQATALLDAAHHISTQLSARLSPSP